MGLHQVYTKEFKKALVAKVLSRGNRTIAEVCEPLGISKVTASNWVKRSAIRPIMNKEKKWSAESKFLALVETSKMAELDLGEFLRKAGLHSHTLNEWRAEMIGALEPKPIKRDGSAPRIKELERDLRRKDKALAEVSALLVLKKKADLIWGLNAEEE